MRSTTTNIFGLLLPLLISAIAGAGENEFSDLTIAIIDLECVGADVSQGAVVADKVRNTVVSSGSFRVMERDVMQEVLKEQGFQQTGACQTTSCIVEDGQLGPGYLIAGRLTRT